MVCSNRYRLRHCLCWPAGEVYLPRRPVTSFSPFCVITIDKPYPSQAHTAPQRAHSVKMLTEYTYVFAIGTFFALLEAYNNGASTSHQHFSIL